MAEVHLAATYNKPGFDLVTTTHLCCRDGGTDGRPFARGRFAGRDPRPGKLIVLYDDNLISLDGPRS